LPAFQATLSLGGIVVIPVRRIVAKDKAPSNSNLCVGGQSGHGEHEPLRVTEPKTCPTCGEITDTAALKKAIPQPDGTFTVATQDEVKAAQAATSARYKKKLDLVPHKADEFFGATEQGEGLSYLYPEAGNEARFLLILRLIEQHPDLAFACIYTPTSRQALWVVRPKGTCLVLEERVLTENLRPAPEVVGTVNEALLGQLDMLLAAWVQPFDPEAYEGDYLDALQAIEGETVVLDEKRATPSTSVDVQNDDDLTAALAKLAKTAAKKPPRKRAAVKKKTAAKA
jgi:non-homologous end joining protein Ku